MIKILLQALQIAIPSYISNASPVFLSKIKTHPLDFGKKCKDGNRLLGDGKTIEGFFIAILTATIVGIIQNYLININNYSYFLNIPIFAYSLIGFGAMFGDSISSYFKRRNNLKRGEKGGIIEMIDFVIGSFVFIIPFVNYSIWSFLIVILITPLIHRTANIIGYKIGVKREPW